MFYFAALGAWPAHATGDWQSIGPGTVVLFRHAMAPGGGDPEGFQLENCRTQRDLSADGRIQSTGIAPESGEGVVVAIRGRELKVLGRINP